MPESLKVHRYVLEKGMAVAPAAFQEQQQPPSSKLSQLHV